MFIIYLSIIFTESLNIILTISSQVQVLRFKYNPNRMPLDQVYEVEIGNEKDGYTLLDISSEEGLTTWVSNLSVKNAKLSLRLSVCV